VLGSRGLNEIRVGYAGFRWIQDSVRVRLGWPAAGLPRGTPILKLRGYTIGQGHANSHEDEDVENYTVRDNFTTSFSKAGHHTIKLARVHRPAESGLPL